MGTNDIYGLIGGFDVIELSGVAYFLVWLRRVAPLRRDGYTIWPARGEVWKNLATEGKSI
jgi:hypothetical protein